jgi:serine protease Do
MKQVTQIMLGCLIPLMAVSAQPIPTHPPAPPVGIWAAQLTPSGSFLGVHIIEVDDKRARELKMLATYGVEITSVLKGSPAEDGGIEPGDVIVEFRSEKVAGVEHFMRLVRETPVGREVPVTVWRNNSEAMLTAKIGERKPTQLRFRLGCKEGEDCKKPGVDFTMPTFKVDVPIPHIVLRTRALGADLETLEDQLAKHFGVEEGVLVRSVVPNSPAGRADLRAGDVITSAAGEVIRTPRQFRRVLRSTDEETVEIEVVRDRTKKTLQMEPTGPNRHRPRASPQPNRHP